MYYCKERHAYIDRDTGELVIQLEEGDIVPELGPQQTPPRPLAPFRVENGGPREESPFERSDRLLAEQLSRDSEMAFMMSGNSSSSSGGGGVGGAAAHPATPPRLPVYSQFGGTVIASGRGSKPTEFGYLDEEAAYPGGGGGGAVYSLNDDEFGGGGGDEGLHLQRQQQQQQHQHQHSNFGSGVGFGGGGGGGGGAFLSDWSLARALQAMEFEIETETLEERQRYEQEEEQDRDFRGKEYGASSCRKQMLTISTFVCVAQICILIAECSWDGMAPESENPMFGPPATTMVRFGAKDTSLILYKKQWWRLISPIFLHAGVVHLISNVLIQLRVGGYLNLVFGNAKWVWIYLVSGVFGNIVSCCFLPNSVGVGSSGALLGMLSSWIVWIVFRWKKIPQECRGQRNCQLGVVFVSVAITLGMSFSQYVDWGAHFGGAVMGILWGIILLSNELDNKFHALVLRVACLCISIGLWIGGLYYINAVLKPSTINWAVYKNNDDWHHHNGQT